MHTLLAAALKAVQALEESIEYSQVPGWSPSIERRREALQALQVAIREGLEPSGWKLVPLSPTPTMIRAHDEVLQMIDRTWVPAAPVTSSAYRAMLLTAPRWDPTRTTEKGSLPLPSTRHQPATGAKAASVRRITYRL